MRSKLLILCAVVLLAVGLHTAHAAGTSAVVTWKNPIFYSDNVTPLPATDIKSWTITWSRTSGGPAVGTVVATSFTPTTIPTPCGAYFVTVSVTTSATATFPNLTSSPSGPVNYASGVQCGPLAPTNVSVVAAP